MTWLIIIKLSSNSPLALRLVKGDRRWFMPKVSQQKATT
jgi:hypothetical protein